MPLDNNYSDDEILECLRYVLHSDRVSLVRHTEGGIVNQSMIVQCSNERNKETYFVKFNDKSVTESLFAGESRSLLEIERTGTLRVPTCRGIFAPFCLKCLDTVLSFATPKFHS